MKTIFKDISNSIIVLSILSGIFGIVLIAYPKLSLMVLGMTVAVYLIIHGITLIVLDFRARRLYLPFEGMLQGVLSIMLGILLSINPMRLAVYIGISLGLWIIISSINSIKLSASLKGKDAPWILMMILNIIDILVGAVILFTPVLSSVSITVCMGIVIIAHSVINIVNMISVKRNANKLEKFIIERAD